MSKAPKQAAVTDNLWLPAMGIGPKGPADAVVLPAQPGTAPATNAPSDASQLVAPPAIIDRFPIVIGAPLQLGYITATYRLANEGFRWMAVDVWNELLEHDPHARGVIRKRILPIAGADVTVEPAEMAADAPQADKDQAKKIADECQRQILQLPALRQEIQRLAWAIIYGMGACETEWANDDKQAPKGWAARRLHFIHSRRLNLTNPSSWEIYIYDQGPTAPWSSPRSNSTIRGYGVPVSEYPFKFVVHVPALNGDYAVRDGEARYVGVYLALKRMIVRCTAQDFERVIRPWVVGYFNREQNKDKNPVANQVDIRQLLGAVQALGTGSLNGVILPDAVKVELLKAVSQAGNPREFADWLDNQVTKSLLGQTYTTSPSARGTHDAADVADQGTEELIRYDAACLGDTLSRDLAYPIALLNFGEDLAKRFPPRVVIGVDREMANKEYREALKAATACDIPIDARAAGEQLGLPVIAEQDMEKVARTRVVAASKDHPIEPGGSDDPNSPDFDEDANAAAAGVDADGNPIATPKAANDTAEPAPNGQPVKPGKKPKKPAVKPKPDDDAATKAADIAAESAHRALLSDKAFLLGDRGVAQAVYDSLREDYPARSLAWILSGQWRGPVEIPIDQIDFSTKSQWVAYKEQQENPEALQGYVDRIKNGKRKPVVLVKTPGNELYEIVDGHHRTLAQQQMGTPVLAYVIDVQVDDGPWVALHAMQKGGSSKGSYSREPASYFDPDQMGA
jgi:phage gp29-like protein